MATKRRTYRRTFIRQWREFRGLSLDRLVDRLPENPDTGKPLITKQSLSRIELGKQPYSQAVLEGIAEALGCSPADLLVRDPTDHGAPWSLLDTIRGMPQERQAEAAQIVEAFASAAKKTGTAN